MSLQVEGPVKALRLGEADDQLLGRNVELQVEGPVKALRQEVYLGEGERVLVLQVEGPVKALRQRPPHVRSA